MNEEILLVQRILDGEKEAFGLIAEKYKNSLYALVLRMVPHKEQAKKIVKDCLTDVYEVLPEFKEEEFFSDWFHRHVTAFLRKRTLPAKKEQMIQIDYISFYNPHYEEVEEAILSLHPERRFEFLLYQVLNIKHATIAEIIEMDTADVEKGYFASLSFIRKRIMTSIETESGEECFTFSELTSYFDGVTEEKYRQKYEEHMEFCPSCREKLKILKREKSDMEKVLYSPALDENYNDNVLRELLRYEKKPEKQRTWKYQLGAIGIIIATFLFIAIVIPAMKPIITNVSNYLVHGAFYNVWSKGTYSVTDKDLTLEVTNIELDPLFFNVYYEISGDNDTSESYQEGDDLYDVKIIDEHGNAYPVEVSPVMSMDNFSYFDDEHLAKELHNPYFVVKPLEAELPDNFTLQVNTYLLQGKSGNWKLEIPIRYDKVDKDIKVVELNETIEIDNKVEVEFLTMKYGNYGSRLSYQVRLTEAEEERIEKLLNENPSYNPNHYQTYNNVHASVQVANRNEQYMMPIGYRRFFEINQDKPIEQDFSFLLFNRDYTEFLGKEVEIGEYFADINYLQYSEPVFHTFSIPFEEVENKRLDMKMDGYMLTDYTIEQTNKGFYNLVINAKSDGAQSRLSYSWSITNINVQMMTHHDHSLDIEEDAEFPIIEMEFLPTSSPTEEIIITATDAFRMYRFNGEKRIPLD